MALILPSAPANFYDPSLTTLKNAIDAVNGTTKGQIALITAVPADIEAAWLELGVAGNTTGSVNRGSLVVGHKPCSGIVGPVLGPEEAPGENGYKLQFDANELTPIYVDGSGTSTVVVIGAALIEGVDTYAAGTDNHVKYIFKVNPLTVTDGSYISLPAVELIINYSEVLV